MNLKSFFCYFLCLVVLPFFSIGQPSVKGVVKTSDGTYAQYASIILLDAKDSSSRKGVISDDIGQFYFDKVSQGEYVILASMVGYKKHYSSKFNIESENINLSDLVLFQEDKQISAINVSAQRLTIEQSIDRISINVQKSISSAGSTILDVLERSPGLSIDRENGQITFNGRSGVLIMIDGKINRVPISTMIQFLSGMQASNIEKIELISNPSSLYDAEGGGGIISIVLKKNTVYGTSGTFSLMAGVGIFEKIGPSFNIGYKNKKFTITGDFSYLWDKTLLYYENGRKYIYKNNLYNNFSISNRYSHLSNPNLNLNLDYILNSNTNMSANVSYYDNRRKLSPDIVSSNYVNNYLVNTIATEHHEINLWRNFTTALSLNHIISKKTSINFDLSYLKYKNRDPQQYINTVNNTQDSSVQVLYTNADKTTPINLFVGKVDLLLSNPTKKLRVELGLKGSISNLKNIVDVSNLENGEWVPNLDYTQSITLRENIGASYMNFNYKVGLRSTIQAGLRWESTSTDIKSFALNQLLLRKYNNWFPNIVLTKSFSDFSALQVSYSKRIGRPAFTDLAPYIMFVDPNTFSSGNLFLKSSITNVVQLNYKFNGTIINLSYNLDHNLIIPSLVKVDTVNNKQYSSPENIDKSFNYTLSVNFPITFGSFFKMQNTILGVNQNVSTNFENRNISLNKSYIRYTFTNLLKIPKKDYAVEISGFYQSSSLQGLSNLGNFGAINMGISKKMSNNKGQLKLSISDILKTQRSKVDNYFPFLNIDQRKIIQVETRVLRLIYTYTLGSKQSGSKNLDVFIDEKSRIEN